MAATRLGPRPTFASIILTIYGLAGANVAIATEVDIFDGRGFGGPACSATIRPDAATADLRPLRLRIVSQNGADLVLAATALDGMAGISLVMGDQRTPLQPNRIDDLAALRASPVWAALFASRRIHLTEMNAGGLIRTARFDDFDLEAILQRMASECDSPALLSDLAATVPVAVDLNPDLIRLIKLAAFRILGEDRAPGSITPVLEGAGQELVGRALMARGHAATAPLSADLILTLLAEFGVGILPQFTEAGDFEGGLAPVATSAGWGMIDQTAGFTLPPRFPRIVHHTLRGATVQIGGLWSAIRTDGTRIRGATFDRLGPCAAELCVYRDHDETGLFDLAGGARNPVRFDDITEISSEGMAIQTADGWSVHDASGRRLAGPISALWVGAPSDGVVRAQIDAARWMLLDAATLQPRSPATFDELRLFPGGLAAAKLDQSWGFVALRTADFVIEPRFGDVGAFSLGLAPATLDGQTWGYIDKQGDWAIAPIYSDAAPFRQGRARVRVAGAGVGFIDTLGRFVIPAVFDDARDFANDYAAVRFGTVWGFVAREQRR